MAEKITLKVSHSLTLEEARQRIETGFEKVQQQALGKKVNLRQNWNGDEMDFEVGVMSQSITGTLLVGEKTVVIEINLPWFLAALSGSIEDKLHKSTQLLLDKK